MASTYSNNLKIELVALGEQAGTWGTTTNTNLGTALEEAIVGYGNPDFTSDADLTLTLSNSNATQVARNLVLNVTSSASLTVTRNLVVPTIEKPYIVQNNTTGGQSIVVKTSGGSGVTIPNGLSAFVYTDGTDVVSAINYIPTLTSDSLTLTSALSVANGGTGATTASGARTNLGSTTVGDALFTAASKTAAQQAMDTEVGVDVQAYDADLTALGGLAKTDGNFIVGNGSTWVAESGSTARASLGLGSMATQNSNAVSISGGSITATLSTTSVLNATAGASAGAVGTYAWLGQTTTTTYHLGSTVSGSTLRPAGIAAPGSWNLDDPAGGSQYVKPKGEATTMSGTWRCMGEAGTGTTYAYAATLWLRIS